MGGAYHGTISRMSKDGDAWIDCPEVQNQYGVDAHVFRSVAASTELYVGAEVAFNIHNINAKSQPQVSAPIWIKHEAPSKGSSSGGKGDSWGGKGDGVEGFLASLGSKGKEKGKSKGKGKSKD